ncbi:MAG: glycerophosphodiester phosphodiesterase family protein [Actinomycetota bacterium]
MTHQFPRTVAVAVMLGLTVLSASCSNSPSATPTVPSTTVPSTAAPVTTAPVTTAPVTTAPVTTTTTSVKLASTIDELLHLGRPIVLAHTGGEDNFPASTMFSFGESAKAGVDMLDLNVMLTKDNVLVVQHDDSVDRNTAGTGKVADLTFAQIHALDAAYWFSTACSDCHDKPAGDYLYRGMRTGKVAPPAGYTADDFALPSLEQLVQRFPNYPLNIEIKGSGAVAKRAADVLAKQLHDLQRDKDTVVASFEDDIVTYFHKVAPDIEVSPGLQVMTDYVLKGKAIPDGMRILQLPPEYSGVKVITPKLVADAAKRGYPIWIWPNDRKLENYDHYLAYLEQGIPGLNINFPSQGVKALATYTARAGLKAVAPSAGCSARSGAMMPAASTVDLTAAGLKGTYIRNLPAAYDGVTPLPIVFDLHGWSQPAALKATEGRLPEYGDLHRFITVEPDITRPVPRWDSVLGSADLTWFGALLDSMEVSLCVDTSRIYVTGMSNGAMMTSMIACTFADRVAAVAPVSGVRSPSACAPTRHIPIETFHGTDDPYLAYTGGYGPKVASLLAADGKGTIGGGVIAKGDEATSVPDMMAAWATRNGCEPTPTKKVSHPDVTLTGWQCPSGGATELYTIVGGGHTWPASAFDAKLSGLMGHTTSSINATTIMWSFFEDHPLA